MSNHLPLILGMMLVTFVPRLLPWFVLAERPLPPLLRRFLFYIPYTALGALITRGVLDATADMTLITLAGIGVAAACSWYRGGLVSSVAAAIIAVFLLLSAGS
ncbi:AzlD domain-containing protein [Sporomusa aerivorans]|uniref:AzlD domain-containing protein n=1 Tax=Sporomusa aerivorans TaxID=204936 RepID=UPI00352AC9E9